MERTNSSHVGDIKSPTSREEYSITQMSSAEDHVTYLARSKYAADQPIRVEDNSTTGVNIEKGLIKCQELGTSTPTDNSVMCRGTLSTFFSPRPYSKSISPISHVTWNQEKDDSFLRHSCDDLPEHTSCGREFSSSPSDKLPVIPPISRKEPIKCREFGTSTPTDSFMMCRENVSTFFSPRPYSKSISPISHVTWNQSHRFLSHSFGDSADQTCGVNNPLTLETKDTHDDHKENESQMADVVECDDKKENETHMAEVVEGDDKKENETHMAEVMEGDDHKGNGIRMGEVVEGDDKKENETHMADAVEGDDHKENETHMADVVEGDDKIENETHMAEVMVGRDGEIESINDDEQHASGDWEELEQLKKAYEEIMQKKEQIDELVERKQLALEEQDRILEDIMQIARAEHDGMEKVAGEFTNSMKTYTHFKEETTNRRVYHKEVEIQADILHEENDELAKEISEQVFNINEIEELRLIGLKTLKEKTEEMKRMAEQMKGDNKRLESDIKKKVEEFSNLRMELNDRGIPYVSERKPVQVNGIKIKKSLPLIEHPLKSNTENLIEHLYTIDTAQYEKTLKNVLEKVTFTSTKEVKNQVSGTPDYSARLNEGSGGMTELCYEKVSEKLQDLNKDVENFEKKAFEMKLRIEGSGDEMESCYDKGSENVLDLNKEVDDFEKTALVMKLKISALSSDLDTLHRQEGFAEGRKKDGDINDARLSDCFERHCLGEESNLTNKDNALQEHSPGMQGVESNVIEIDTDNRYEVKLKPTKQLSALELVRLPGKRDMKTKIPKPMFHPYGSAVRDGDKHVVSKKSSSVVVLRKDYDRKRHVPESQRNAFEAVVGYVSAESENQPHSKYQSPLAHETKRGSCTEFEHKATSSKTKGGTLNKIRNGEIKSKINTGRQNIEKQTKDDSLNIEMANLPNDENQSLKKSMKTKPRGNVTEPFKPRKSEIKPRIDTRLNAVKQKQENPVQKETKLSKQNKLKSHARSKIDKATKPAVSRKGPNPKQLPPLKKINKEFETGKTVANSRNSEVPLQKIKPARKQGEHKLTSMFINDPNKQERAKCPLPPIGRSSTTGHDPDYKVNVSISTSSCASMASTPLSPFTHSVVGKLPLMESDHFTSSSGYADPFIPPSLSPPSATSPTKQKLHPETEVVPLHRKPVLSRKSIKHAQQRELATTCPLFTPTPPQSPPPSSRRSRKLRNMPILANSPTIDPDRKPHLRA